MITNFSEQDRNKIQTIFLVKDGKVVNLIVAKPEFVEQFYGDCDAAYISSKLIIKPDIGWEWSNGEFIPPTPDMIAHVKKVVSEAIAFGQALMIEFATENILKGMTTAQISELSARLEEIQRLMDSGSLYTAEEKIALLTEDSLVTSEMKRNFRNKIRTYLNLPLV